jgi:hypothetical protein
MFAMLIRGAKSAAGGGATVAMIGASISNGGSAAQSINTSVSTVVSYDTKNFDTSGFTTGGGPYTTLTAPFTSLYFLTAQVYWANAATASYRLINLFVNGSSEDFSFVSSTTTEAPVNQLSVLLNSTAGDVWEIQVEQNVGAATNIVGFSGQMVTYFQAFSFH